MKIELTSQRIYEMDVERIKRDFSDVIAADISSGLTEERALRETFYELCGWDRDIDHVDGSYVWLISEDFDADFDFGLERDIN